MNRDGPQPPVTAASLREAHPRLRVDRLRKALRGKALDLRAVSGDLKAWLELFAASDDPALLVLLLEMFSQLDDERVVAVARASCRHRSDGVRLEALRLLLDRHHEEIVDRAREHRGDRSLEVQLLVCERLFVVSPAESIDLLFEIFEAERGGPREHHALERGVEFLVEAAPWPITLARLRSIASDFDDREGFIAWGIEQMEKVVP